MAETVAHASRPSTAPLRALPQDAPDDSRPATPPGLQGGGGWQGGRGGADAHAPGTANLGHVTPHQPAAMIPGVGGSAGAEGPVQGGVQGGLGSPSAGWQVAASSLQPARKADPNHPLRAGVGISSSLDDTAASATQSVYCSTLDDTQATGTTFGMAAAAAALPAAEAGDRLRSSLNMALDLFNVARASGQRGAVADIVASLRASQHRIAEVLAAHDEDLAAVQMQQESRPGAPKTGQVREGALPDASGAWEDESAARVAPRPPVSEKERAQVPHAGPAAQVLATLSDSAAAASTAAPPDDASDKSPLVTTRHLAVPALALPAAATAAGGRCKETGAQWHETRGEEGGGGAPGACSQATLSTALPSARSSMEYGGSNLNSHRCNFESLSEISIASEGRTVVDVEEVLERYSERLLQMVSAKLRQKGSSAASALGQGEDLA